MVRIPSNACPGCNDSRPISTYGLHRLKDGSIIQCEFVRDAVERENVNLLRVCKTKKGARIAASVRNASILRVSAGPYEYWAVVR